MAKATLAKGSRISGTQRTTLASQYAQRYTGGESIRTIAEDAGRSYGFVHNVLKESGVALRGRGGATRGTRKTGPAGPAKPAASEAPATKTAAKKVSAGKAAPAKQPAAAKKAARKTAAKS